MKSFLFKFYGSLIALLISIQSYAQVLSYSGVEIEYQYTASFIGLLNVSTYNELSASEKKEALTSEAQFHFEHLFGFFQSPDYAKKFKIDTDLTEGFAGPSEASLTNVKAASLEGQNVEIQYNAKGKALVHKNVAKAWLKKGSVVLPLLYDFSKIYKNPTSFRLDLVFPEEYLNTKWQTCTDSHYKGASDFSYFYNPYSSKEPCSDLKSSPLARDVKITVKPVLSNESLSRLSKKSIPLNRLKSDNENGKLFVTYFIQGFDHMTRKKTTRSVVNRDSGSKVYKYVNAKFKSLGFKRMGSKSEFLEWLDEDQDQIHLLTGVTLDHLDQKRFISTWVKEMKDSSGKNIKAVVRNGLFHSENTIESNPLSSFAKFWKEAWENADYLHYGGHSGDGISMSIDTMDVNFESLGIEPIVFNKDKYQIAYFDACSTYSHYMDTYLKQKNGKNLNLFTYGLVSLFKSAAATIDTVVDLFFNQNGKTTTWLSFMESMEKSHLAPHVESDWDKADWESQKQYYLERKIYPTYLLNASGL